MWQLTTHTTSTLLLAEVSATHGQIGAAVELTLEGHAFAGLALAADRGHGDCALYLLFSDKSAAQLRLHRPAAVAAAGGVRGSGAAGGAHHQGAAVGVLDGLHAGSLQLLPLAPQLAPVGAPAALAVAGSHLVIAGASDAVAAVPLHAFDAGDATAASTFTTSTSLLQRLVGSLYQPVARSSVVAAFPVRGGSGAAAGRRGGRQSGELLALVDDSGALRLWSPPPSAAPLASHELLPGAAARSLAPCAAFAAGGAPDGELLVVAQLEAPDAPGAATLAACHIRVSEGGGSGGGGGADGMPAAGSAEVVARFALQLPATGARLLGAQLRGRELLVLAALPGADTRLLTFSARDGAYLGAARLLSRGPAAGAWGAEDDLWAAAIGAFPGRASAEDAVAGGQLLVPGQLCRAALREALRYWGANLAAEQVEAASHAQLRAYLKAALLSVAARHPAWSEAQRWHALFARYCECWARLHAPLALASAGGGALLGVVRGGLALTALREGTRLEAEEGGGGGSGSASGATPAARAVRACLAAIGGALGGPALRLMARLAAAGVDLEGALLPRFLDLLLYGPSPDGGGGGDDAARRRLAEWRALRQAALLSVQQALDALPDPVAAIRCANSATQTRLCCTWGRVFSNKCQTNTHILAHPFSATFLLPLTAPPQTPSSPTTQRLCRGPAAVVRL